jgi:hypothetical protein
MIINHPPGPCELDGAKSLCQVTSLFGRIASEWAISLTETGAVHQTTTAVAVGLSSFGPPRRQNQWYHFWRDVIPRIGVASDLSTAIHTLSQDDETSDATVACQISQCYFARTTTSDLPRVRMQRRVPALALAPLLNWKNTRPAFSYGLHLRQLYITFLLLLSPSPPSPTPTPC